MSHKELKTEEDNDQEQEERARSAAYTLGKELNEEQVAWLEENLKQEPQDLISRLELIGYYQFQSREEGQKLWCLHILALIENHPDLTGYAAAIVMNAGRKMSQEQFAEARNLWQKKTEEHPDNGAVHGNAGAFLLFADLETADRLLDRACLLEPFNVRWPAHLSLFHYMAFKKAGDKAEYHAERVVKYGRQSVDLGSPTPWLDLEHMGECALAKGNPQEAKAFAAELSNLNIHATHRQAANAITGLAALQEGEKETAVALLLAKEEGFTSHRLTWKLAAALLHEQEREAVSVCINQYRKPLGKLADQWLADLEKDSTPDFRQAEEN